MVYLRVQVQCFRCGNEVEKTKTREIAAVNKEKRFECFGCFRSHKQWKILDSQPNEKEEFYCQSCKYTFKSRKRTCPYCNKSEHLANPNVSVSDLL